MARKYLFLVSVFIFTQIAAAAGHSERLFKCVSPGLSRVIAILEGNDLLPTVNVNLYRADKTEVQCIASPTLVRKAHGPSSLEIHCGPERIELTLNAEKSVTDLVRFAPEGVSKYACHPTE